MKRLAKFNSSKALEIARRINRARKTQTDYRAVILHVAACMVENYVDGDSEFCEGDPREDWVAGNTRDHLGAWPADSGLGRRNTHHARKMAPNREAAKKVVGWFTSGAPEDRELLEAAISPTHYIREFLERAEKRAEVVTARALGKARAQIAINAEDWSTVEAEGGPRASDWEAYDEAGFPTTQAGSERDPADAAFIEAFNDRFDREDAVDCADCGRVTSGHVVYSGDGGSEKLVCELCMNAHYDAKGFPQDEAPELFELIPWDDEASPMWCVSYFLKGGRTEEVTVEGATEHEAASNGLDCLSNKDEVSVVSWNARQLEADELEAARRELARALAPERQPAEVAPAEFQAWAIPAFARFVAYRAVQAHKLQEAPITAFAEKVARLMHQAPEWVENHGTEVVAHYSKPDGGRYHLRDSVVIDTEDNTVSINDELNLSWVGQFPAFDVSREA